jgi:hypothetical protein
MTLISRVFLVCQKTDPEIDSMWNINYGGFDITILKITKLPETRKFSCLVPPPPPINSIDVIHFCDY